VKTIELFHSNEEKKVSTAPNDPANGLGAGQNERESTTDRIAEKAHETIDRAAARSNELEEDVRRAAADTAERVRRREERLETSVDQNLEKIKDYVQKNPIASAGIAFVAGVLLSSLLRR
jgi:ElaB/YqjD/DUF883 family membrane-anchored ribosome-binding protein